MIHVSQSSTARESAGICLLLGIIITRRSSYSPGPIWPYLLFQIFDNQQQKPSIGGGSPYWKLFVLEIMPMCASWRDCQPSDRLGSESSSKLTASERSASW